MYRLEGALLIASAETGIIVSGESGKLNLLVTPPMAV